MSTSQKTRRSSYAGMGSAKNPCQNLIVQQLARPQSSNSLSTMLNNIDDSPLNHRSKSSNLQQLEDTYSQQSILSAMDRFVTSVNNMGATVLVPSRLRDIDIETAKRDGTLPPNLSNSDLYSFYEMLNKEKSELLWGKEDEDEGISILPDGVLSPGLKLHTSLLRQPSAGSNTPSVNGQESDSEEEAIASNDASEVASQFRYHLKGLNDIFHKLADSADYLSKRYQEEIGSTDS